MLVCGKCSRKQGGGFGRKGRTPLAKALRRALGLGKGRKAAIGIVETRCLGLCPAHGVTLLNAAAPGDWLVARPGTPLPDVIAALGLEDAQPGEGAAPPQA
ncbi:hypothetical protein GVO57_09020 [Sphingomonas changnyeongensis]|uniref:(2Fe-2S) ferredoxin domain-containing protein n=1 Tax=Sphingomonas changnyeongensis TaxID=2698679 RepID=A0A7Z2NWR5_9SPHN|nr:hypothetical protein [Sphingomonas changnyeongensis]QHL90932.1 hypothetical protein GVO57_09020 [Sphingomonas changnyeongensis]